MAIPTNAQTTYTTVGNREDLTDEIWKISPTETPFFSAVEKIGTKAVNHEWQTVALDAVDTANAQLEGDVLVVGEEGHLLLGRHVQDMHAPAVLAREAPI